jgi:butyrate response factor
MIQSQLLTPPKQCKALSDTHSDVSTDHDDLEHTPEHSHITPPYTPSKHRSSKAKSSLCRNFTEKGFCPYGSKCQFAHGPEELRINMETNRSYKTKGCHAFAKKGYCSYGDRCNFIHLQET